MSLVDFIRKRGDRVAAYLVGPVSFLAIYAMSIATEERHQVVVQSNGPCHQVEKSEVERWLKKYEELEWFSTVEPCEKAIYETPSKMVFGKGIPAFDRSLLRLKIFDIILVGGYEDYLELVKEQPKEVRLEWNQFQDMQNQIRTIVEGGKRVTPEGLRESIEFALVMCEIGETETARNKGWVYEIVASDARTFISLVMEKHPEILPSYSKLKPEQQRIVKTILTLVSFQEISDLCVGEEVFDRVKKSKIIEEEPELFELALFVYVCELAGTLGDHSFCSSPWYTKYACQNVDWLRKAFYLLKEKGAKEAAEYYLAERANCLGLDPGSPLARVLTRVGAMMKLYTAPDGKILKEAFLKFPPDELATIVAEFDIHRRGDRGHRLNGLDSLLLVLKGEGHLGVSEKDKVSHSVSTTFPFLVKVLREQGKAPYLNFRKIIPLATKDPSILKEGKISITNDGVIIVARPTSK